MSKIMKKRAFTLIELIAILVILAILALIVTPLVMNIIRKAGIVANRRSVDLAITSYLLETGTFPTDLSDLTVEYTGKEVICNIMILKDDNKVYLSECKANNKKVLDDTTKDGWYHYGKDQIYEIGDIITYKGKNTM